MAASLSSLLVILFFLLLVEGQQAVEVLLASTAAKLSVLRYLFLFFAPPLHPLSNSVPKPVKKHKNWRREWREGVVSKSHTSRHPLSNPPEKVHMKTTASFFWIFSL
jgi:hypothetical protein